MKACVLSPSAYVFFKIGGLQVAICVIVDDLDCMWMPSFQDRIQKLCERFKLGEWKDGGGGELLSRRILHDKAEGDIVTDQTDQLAVIFEDPCAPELTSELRSKVFKAAWYARETRGDMLGDICLLQQQFPNPKVKHIRICSGMDSARKQHISCGVLLRTLKQQSTRHEPH